MKLVHDATSEREEQMMGGQKEDLFSENAGYNSNFLPIQNTRVSQLTTAFVLVCRDISCALKHCSLSWIPKQQIHLPISALTKPAAVKFAIFSQTHTSI